LAEKHVIDVGRHPIYFLSQHVNTRWQVNRTVRGLALKKSRPPVDLTPSICEEVLEQFSKSDDSLAGVIEANSIEVRDFMILSFICDQSELGIEQLSRAIGLSRQSILDCIERLVGAGLVEYRQVSAVRDPVSCVSPTPTGRTITRRAGCRRHIR
jgi:DNA-binding MarR family transcriptional regulator